MVELGKRYVYFLVSLRERHPWSWGEWPCVINIFPVFALCLSGNSYSSFLQTTIKAPRTRRAATGPATKPAIQALEKEELAPEPWLLSLPLWVVMVASVGEAVDVECLEVVLVDVVGVTEVDVAVIVGTVRWIKDVSVLPSETQKTAIQFCLNRSSAGHESKRV